MSTRAALANVRRPVVAVELPGGSTLPVRHLTVAELRRVDARAAELPEGENRNVRSTVLLVASALAEPDGSATFPELTEADLAAVELALTASQMSAVCQAAAGGSKDDAKKN